MTQQEILEGNKLIVQFMCVKNVREYQTKRNPNIIDLVIAEDEDGYIDYVEGINYILYHSDWNQLMPVVEKIESLGTGYVMMENNKCEIVITLDNQGKKHFSNRFIQNTKLESVYEGVVEFIKWYNENK